MESIFTYFKKKEYELLLQEKSHFHICRKFYEKYNKFRTCVLTSINKSACFPVEKKIFSRTYYEIDESQFAISESEEIGQLSALFAGFYSYPSGNERDDEIYYRKTTLDFELECTLDVTRLKELLIIGVGKELNPDEKKSVIYYISAKNAGQIVCKKCGKEYKSKSYYTKHISLC